MSAPTLGELEAEGALVGLAPLPSATRIERLKGHASRRRFLRLGGGGESRILVVYPAAEAGDLERYVRTAAWLRAAAVRVPRIHDRGERALLVEDLGSVRLDRPGLGAVVRARAYRQAVDIVERIQRHGRRVGSPNPGWALDAERLRQELEHFERHALAGWLEVGSGASSRGRFYDRLVAAVAALPTAQCHRDFHSRNLMLFRDRLAVVDFQDQMEGPIFYDLASLFRDDYRDVETRSIATGLARFWAAGRRPLALAEAARLPAAPAGLPPVARQAFCLVALQRGLKALGTFGYQVTVAGNRDYAEHAPRTWAGVRRNLALLGWSDAREMIVPLERAFG